MGTTGLMLDLGRPMNSRNAFSFVDLLDLSSFPSLLYTRAQLLFASGLYHKDYIELKFRKGSWEIQLLKTKSVKNASEKKIRAWDY